MAILNETSNSDALASIEASVAQTGSGTSDIVLIPFGLKRGVTVNLVLRSAGTAKIEWSTTPRKDIAEGGTVNWISWPDSDVTATTSNFAAGPINAVRINATSGNWTMEVRGE